MSEETIKQISENEIEINNNLILYKNKVLGKGGFGEIFLGEYILNHYPLAIKVESTKTNPHLEKEYEIMNLIKNNNCFPYPYKFIKTDEKNYLIMELLGQSLDSLFTSFKKQFSIPLICSLAFQMTKNLENLHLKGIIHRDIKLGNFLIGTGNKKHKIFLIDFGLAKKYVDENNKHIKNKEKKGLTGTARFISLFTHKGFEQSRRDDIESLSYNLIYLAKRNLPWIGIRAKNKKEKHKKIYLKKLKFTPEIICKGLPEEFEILLKYSRELKFEEEPDYSSIQMMFKNLLESFGDDLDKKFFWEEELNQI